MSTPKEPAPAFDESSPFQTGGNPKFDPNSTPPHSPTVFAVNVSIPHDPSDDPAKIIDIIESRMKDPNYKPTGPTYGRIAPEQTREEFARNCSIVNWNRCVQRCAEIASQWWTHTDHSVGNIDEGVTLGKIIAAEIRKLEITATSGTVDMTGTIITTDDAVSQERRRNRELVAQFSTSRSFATGHGDTIEDLLAELGAEMAAAFRQARAQATEVERERCARVAEAEADCLYNEHVAFEAVRRSYSKAIAAAIRRGE